MKTLVNPTVLQKSVGAMLMECVTRMVMIIVLSLNLVSWICCVGWFGRGTISSMEISSSGVT